MAGWQDDPVVSDQPLGFQNPQRQKPSWESDPVVSESPLDFDPQAQEGTDMIRRSLEAAGIDPSTVDIGYGFGTPEERARRRRVSRAQAQAVEAEMNKERTGEEILTRYNQIMARRRGMLDRASNLSRNPMTGEAMTVDSQPTQSQQVDPSVANVDPTQGISQPGSLGEKMGPTGHFQVMGSLQEAGLTAQQANDLLNAPDSRENREAIRRILHSQSGKIAGDIRRAESQPQQTAAEAERFQRGIADFATGGRYNPLGYIPRADDVIEATVEGVQHSAAGTLGVLERALGQEADARYYSELSDALASNDEGEVERHVSAISQSMSDLITGYLGGAPGIIGTFTLKATNDAIDEGREAGLEGPELGRYALTQGAIEGLITAAFQRFAPGIESIGRQPFSAGVKEALKRFGIMSLQELPEEFTVALGQQLNRQISGVDPNAMSAETWKQLGLDLAIQTIGTVGVTRTPDIAQAPFRGRAQRQQEQEAQRTEQAQEFAARMQQAEQQATGEQGDQSVPTADPNATAEQQADPDEQRAQAAREAQPGAEAAVGEAPAQRPEAGTVVEFEDPAAGTTRGTVRGYSGNYALVQTERGQFPVDPASLRVPEDEAQGREAEGPVRDVMQGVRSRPPAESPQTPQETPQAQPTQPPAEAAQEAPGQAMRGIRRRQESQEMTREQVVEEAVQADPDAQQDPAMAEATRGYFEGELGKLRHADDPFVEAEVPLEMIAERQGGMPAEAGRYAQQDPATAPAAIGGLMAEGDQVVLVDGNNRFTAAKQRGDATMKVRVPKGDIQALGLDSRTARAEARARKAEEGLERLYDEARTDPLTGLGNRKKYDETLEDYRQRADETGKPLSVLTLDAANLKAANDVLGHEGANEALRQMADAVKSAVRTEGRQGAPDVVATRQGGDEFAIILPDTSEADARKVLERVEQAAGQHELIPGVSMFLAGEVGTYTKGKDLQEVITEADKASETRKRARKEELGELTERSEVEQAIREHQRMLEEGEIEYDTLGARQNARRAGDLTDILVERGERYWRDNVEQTHQSISLGRGEETVQRMPTPELVEFYRQLTGKYPKVLARLGGTLGYFDPADETVAINWIMSADDRALAKTLAHEIGHLVDYLPQKAVRDRTNILGRLAQIRRFTRTVLEDEMLGQVKRDEIQAELESLSHKWREDIMPLEQAQQHPALLRHRQYRVSGPELYADFVSVMLNDPALARMLAPVSFDVFAGGVQKKHDVVDSYLRLQDMLRGTPEQIAADRSKRIMDEMGKTEQVLKQAAAKKEAERQSFTSAAQQMFLDSGKPAITAVRKSSPKGDGQELEFALGEFALVDQEGALATQRLEREVGDRLREAGLDRDVLDQYLMLNRIAGGDRAKYLNPFGYTKAEAEKQMEQLLKPLSKEQRDALEEAVDGFMDVGFDLATKLHEVGAYSDELFETIQANKGKYAVFTPLDHLVDNASWNVKSQIGTFKPIGRPLTVTYMKYMAMARMYELQKARGALIQELQKAGIPVEIKRVSRYKRPPQEDVNHSVIQHWYNGKPYWVKMHTMYANALKRNDIGSLSRFARYLNTASYRGFHDLYVTGNIGWMVMNLPRDFKATAKGVAAHAQRKKGWWGFATSMPKLLQGYLETLPSAVRHARGLPDKLGDEMMQNRALASLKVADLMRTKEQAEYDEKWAAEFGEGLAGKNKAANMLTRAYNGLVVAANFTEAWSKMAGYRVLQDMGFEGKELANIVRNDVGTPNIYTRGTATGLTNAAFMYQKVAVNGWRRDFRLARSKETRKGWWAAYMMTSGMARLAQIAAAWGLFGDELKEYLDSVPEYDKTNYIIVPLPWSRDKHGRVGYMRLPEDHSERWIGGMLWKMVQAMGAEDRFQLEQDLKDMFNLTSSQVPGASTAIKIPMAWMTYASGGNPIDDWRRRPIIGRDEFKAGGTAALGDMVRWTGDQFGILSEMIVRPLFGEWWDPRDKTSIQTAVEWAPGVNRLIRYSDQGVTEQMWEEEAAEEAMSARFRLSLPRDARDLTRLRHQYMRWTTGDSRQELNAQQWTVKGILDDYYRQYLDVTKAIRESEQAGDTETGQKLRRDLAEMSREIKELIESEESRR